MKTLHFQKRTNKGRLIIIINNLSVNTNRVIQENYLKVFSVSEHLVEMMN